MLVVCCGLGVGLLQSRPLLACASLTLLIWIGIEWVLFRWRTEIGFQKIRCRRIVNDYPPGPTQTTTLWVGRPLKMRLQIESTGWLRIPFARLTDNVPDAIHVTSGSPTCDAVLTSRAPLEFDYECTPLAAGEVTWPGVSVRIMDLQGLFYSERFLASATTRAKRINAGPVIRGSLFRVLPLCSRLDAPRPLKKRMNAVAPPGIHRCQQIGMGSELLELREYQPGDPPKSIAWKVSARKDCLMTRQYESEVPIRTTIFLDGCRGSRLGPFGRRPIDQCITLTVGLTEALMSHRDPVGICLFEDNSFTMLKPGAGSRHFYDTLDKLARFSANPNRPRPVFTPALRERVCTTAEVLYPELMQNRVTRLPWFILPNWLTNRTAMLRRLKIGYLLRDMYQLAADAPVRLAYDDMLFAEYGEQFLNDHGVAWVGPNYDDNGHNLFESTYKMNVLNSALLHAVSRSKDNELFVVMVDLIDHTPRLYDLIAAIRLARARHHRVVVICPWPTVQEFFGQTVSEKTAHIVARAERLRLEESAKEAMTAIRRLGVPVAFATEDQAAQLVIAEAELARSGRATLAGSRGS